MELNAQRRGWIQLGAREARPAPDQLTFDLALLARGLGYRGLDRGAAPQTETPLRRPLPDHLRAPAQAILSQGRDLLELQWLWMPLAIRFDAAHEAVECLAPHSGRLSVGPLVHTQLRGADALAAFVVSIGSRLEQEARALMSAGHALEGYILDTVGSMAVEACADLLATELQRSTADLGWRTTNRFSPGYCTWETADQHALFALLPPGPAGVVLNASALMHPIKSISGVIGLGEDVDYRPYPCDCCALEHCQQRLTASRL